VGAAVGAAGVAEAVAVVEAVGVETAGVAAAEPGAAGLI
jgi:hypothetical protein